MSLCFRSQGQVESAIRDWLAEMDGNAGRARSMLRRILAEYPGHALAAVFDIADSRVDPELLGPIASALACSTAAINALSDPALSRLGGAIGVTRAISRLDPGIEAKLMQRVRRSEPDRRAAVTHRVLDLLSAAAPPHRGVPLVLPLTRDPDHRVRSRATLMVGRWKRDARWIAPFLSDADPRVRANALEAAWGVRGAGDLFASATGDGNHRVIANAIVGIHLEGEPCAATQVRGLLESPNPGVQAAGAWAAGHCGFEFLRDVLERLARQPGPSRGAALRALVKLRKAMLGAGR